VEALKKNIYLNKLMPNVVKNHEISILIQRGLMMAVNKTKAATRPDFVFCKAVS
jgi:hypothetical protein